VTAGWLLSQALWLSALAPFACCMAREAASPPAAVAAPAPAPSCHRAAAPAAPEKQCRLRATCREPAAALASLLNLQGVVPAGVPLDAPALPDRPGAPDGTRIPAIALQIESPPPRA